MILSLLMAAADPTAAEAVRMKKQAMHASLFVFPILRELVDAIDENNEAKFARHVRPGAFLADADGNIFPLRASSLQSLVSTCTFQAMAANSDPVEDDGIVYWRCPSGMAQVHFKIIDGKVISASPFRDPSSEGPQAALRKKPR